jgi:hypothetical protein
MRDFVVKVLDDVLGLLECGVVPTLAPTESGTACSFLLPALSLGPRLLVLLYRAYHCRLGSIDAPREAIQYVRGIVSIDGRRSFGRVGRSKASDTWVDRHYPRGTRYRWTGTDCNSPWELEGEATMLEVDAEVRLHVRVLNLVSQFNGAEDIRTDPCPTDTRTQCERDDFLGKHRRPVAKDRACSGTEAPDRSRFNPNRVVETIFEGGVENGLWVLEPFRTDHLDGRKD